MTSFESKTAIPNPVAQLSDLHARLDTLRSNFHFLESEFSLAFQDARVPPPKTFAELDLLLQMLARYEQRRNSKECRELELLLGQVGHSSVFRRVACQALVQRLNQVATFRDRGAAADWRAIWQTAANQFLDYLRLESKFLDAIRKVSLSGLDDAN